MLRLVFALTTCVGLSSLVNAAVVPFAFTPNQGPAATLTFSQPIVIPGGAGNATLTVASAGSNTDPMSNLGAGGDNVNAGEQLAFTMTVDSGNIQFDGFSGFTAVGLEGNDIGSYTSGGPPVLFAINGPQNFANAATFTVQGLSNDAGADPGFRISSIEANFSAVTAVPEPSSLALLVMAGIPVALRRRRN